MNTSSIYVFALIGLMFLIAPKQWWPGFYNPTFFGVTSLLSSVLIILPKLIFRAKEICDREAVTLLRTTILIALLLNGMGELYLYQLYKYGFPYDKILHFIVPFLFVIVLTSFAEVRFGAGFKYSLIIAAFFVTIGSVAWEFFEYLSDLLFKTTEFGIYGQYKFIDTSFDIIFDILGIFTSIISLNQKEFYAKVVSGYCQGKQ